MPHTRPTTDIAKEGLFNIIEHNIDLAGRVTLDLFGGTGSISYELASRGAGHLTIVEKDPVMFSFIRKTLKQLEIDNAIVVKDEVFRFISQCDEQFDFIFAGPPYGLKRLDDLPGEVYRNQLLKEGGWFVLEHTPDHDFKHEPLYKTQRNYGTTIFSIFVNSEG